MSQESPKDLKQAYYDGRLTYREATNRLVYQHGWTYPQADEFFRPLA